jgi:putative PIN family toxin of toxin-antitoxin system
MRNVERFVLDSNIVVSAMMFPNSIPGQAFKKAFREGEVVVSRESMDGLSRTVLHPKFDRYVPLPLRQLFLQEFDLSTLSIQLTSVVNECRDPNDDHLLALGVDAKAKVFITGDRDLLTMHPFRGISLLSAAEFLMV